MNDAFTSKLLLINSGTALLKTYKDKEWLYEKKFKDKQNHIF